METKVSLLGDTFTRWRLTRYITEIRKLTSWSIKLGNILHLRGWSQQCSTTLTVYPGTSSVSLKHRSELNPSNSTTLFDGPCKNIHLYHHIPQFNVWHCTLWRTAPRWQCSPLPMRCCCFFLWTDGWAGATGEKSKAHFMRMYHATIQMQVAQFTRWSW